jgi:RimJ/RimL family protein N-acetyltransferase
VKPISYDNYYWQNELVRLRAWTAGDWEASYSSLFDSPARFLLQEEVELPPVMVPWQEKNMNWANFNAETGRLMFAIETLAGEVVGGLDLNSINERQGTFGIGIQVHTGERGKGYGTAAMRILLRFAFLERRLNKFNSGCVEGNAASAAMHKKLGCIQEGIRRQMYFHEGRHFDWWLFGLTRDEFVETETKLSRG